MKTPSNAKMRWSADEWRGEVRRILTRRFSDPVAHLLADTGLSPNQVTLAGCLLSLGAGYAIARRHPVAGGILLLTSGALDLLDGALARATGKKSRFGAVLDSTLDRLSEASVLFGLLVRYSSLRSTPMILLVYATLVGSVLVSYIRARAEGVGIDCTVGILTRGERTVIMALGLLLGRVPPALLTMALLSWVTAGQRLLQVRRDTRNEA